MTHVTANVLLTQEVLCTEVVLGNLFWIHNGHRANAIENEILSNLCAQSFDRYE